MKDQDYYVVVSEHDGTGDSKWCIGGFAHETHLDTATQLAAKSRIASFGGGYGKCRIARLQFVEDGENE